MGSVAVLSLRRNSLLTDNALLPTDHESVLTPRTNTE